MYVYTIKSYTEKHSEFSKISTYPLKNKNPGNREIDRCQARIYITACKYVI